MLDGGHKEPSCRASDGAFEVFGETAVAVEPSKGAFDNTAARDKFKAHGLVRALHDLECPSAFPIQGGAQFLSGIAAVCKDMAQPREGLSDGRQHKWCAVAVLNIGPVNDGSNQKTIGVSDDVSLAALDLLACVKPTDTATCAAPPFGSVVLTL